MPDAGDRLIKLLQQLYQVVSKYLPGSQTRWRRTRLPQGTMQARNHFVGFEEWLQQSSVCQGREAIGMGEMK
jgi:hypothetical protein